MNSDEVHKRQVFNKLIIKRDPSKLHLHQEVWYKIWKIQYKPR